jgi:rhodanese-related sulfurtransferase
MYTTLKSLTVGLALTFSFAANAGDSKAAKTEKAAHDALAPEIDLTELKGLVDKQAVFVIDANGDSSFKSGRIPGAIHFSKYENKLETVLPKDKSALIVAYCGGPKCTAWEDAAKEAKAKGYSNIKHLRAGIKGWSEAKYPTEKG